MERNFESDSKVVDTPNEDASIRLLMDSQSEAAPLRMPTERTCGSSRPLDIDKEAEFIADFFNNSYDTLRGIDGGTNLLSKDLQKLSGNMDDYNRLLLLVQDKIDSPKGDGSLTLNDWNQETGTWDKVAVFSDFSHCDLFRIAQPGNTLSQIAREQYQPSLGDDNWMKYMNYLVDCNHLKDPNKIDVGQAISFFSLDR